ncbi:MAG TPA: RNA polymerase sigma factor, partial [Urbifossiella sp.]
MIGTRPAEILRHLAPDAVTDAELLERFLRRDDSAFTVLVRRHGPMIFAVCRAITNHHQDAEDAFQAAFLVLAKKAAAIREPKLLGNWLYGVAVRVAQKARRSAARRRSREAPFVNAPEPFVLPGEPAAEYGPLLHEELAKLPTHYREALLLCDLRGVSRAETAKILGIPEGTLSSRLAGGRKKLAERLTRRGIVIVAATIPTALSEGLATASIPDSLLAKTHGLITGWQAGAKLPIHLVRLTQGGVAMRKMMLWGVMSLAVTAIGVVYAAQPDEPKPADPPKAATKPVLVAEERKPEERKRAEALVSFTPPRLQQAFDHPTTNITQVLWSPTGDRLAIEGVNSTGEKRSIITVSMRDRKAGENPERRFIDFDMESRARLVGFTSDGKRLVTELRESELLSGFHRLTFWEQDRAAPQILDLKAYRTIDLESEPTEGYSFSSDGKTYRTVAWQERKIEVPLTGNPSRQFVRSIFSKVWVREISLETGRLLRTLLQVEGDFDSFRL